MKALRLPNIEDLTDAIVPGLLWIASGLCAIALILLGYALWWQFQPHPTVELDAREWTCTEEATDYVPVMVGKVMVMQPRTQCIRYQRR